MCRRVLRTDRFRYRLVSEGVPTAPAEVTIQVNAFTSTDAVDDFYVVDSGRPLVFPLQAACQ